MTKHNRTRPVGCIVVSLAKSIACISSLGFCASCLTSKEMRRGFLNSCVKTTIGLLAFPNTEVRLRPNALDDKSDLRLRFGTAALPYRQSIVIV
jgi:hypothetical protein